MKYYFYYAIIGIGAVLFCYVSVAQHIERRRQKKIIAIRKKVVEYVSTHKAPIVSYSPEDISLTQSKKILLQKNKGKDPNKKGYPSIKPYKYEEVSNFSSKKKGIW